MQSNHIFITDESSANLANQINFDLLPSATDFDKNTLKKILQPLCKDKRPEWVYFCGKQDRQQISEEQLVINFQKALMTMNKEIFTSFYNLAGPRLIKALNKFEKIQELSQQSVITLLLVLDTSPATTPFMKNYLKTIEEETTIQSALKKLTADRIDKIQHLQDAIQSLRTPLRNAATIPQRNNSTMKRVRPIQTNYYHSLPSSFSAPANPRLNQDQSIFLSMLQQGNYPLDIGSESPHKISRRDSQFPNPSVIDVHYHSGTENISNMPAQNDQLLTNGADLNEELDAFLNEMGASIENEDTGGEQTGVCDSSISQTDNDALQIDVSTPSILYTVSTPRIVEEQVSTPLQNTNESSSDQISVQYDHGVIATEDDQFSRPEPPANLVRNSSLFTLYHPSHPTVESNRRIRSSNNKDLPKNILKVSQNDEVNRLRKLARHQKEDQRAILIKDSNLWNFFIGKETTRHRALEPTEVLYNFYALLRSPSPSDMKEFYYNSEPLQLLIDNIAATTNASGNLTSEAEELLSFVLHSYKNHVATYINDICQKFDAKHVANIIDRMNDDKDQRKQILYYRLVTERGYREAQVRAASIRVQTSIREDGESEILQNNNNNTFHQRRIP